MCKELLLSGETLHGDGGADLAAPARIRNGWMKFRELLPILTLEMKGRVYASYVRSNMTYGSDTRPLQVDVGLKFERAEMQMIRWICGISIKDRRTNEELRRLVGVEPITTFIRSGRLRWYGHVMRKGDEDWVKKCMEYRRQKWMDEVPRAFAISDILSSPIGDERSSVCQLCQKQHDLWK